MWWCSPGYSSSSLASRRPIPYQSRLILREGLLVGSRRARGAWRLAGMVAEPTAFEHEQHSSLLRRTALTAVTDNAALTYLGSLVDGLPADVKYSLVAGAVSGGGLTVIANAPNPAGFAILKGTFEDGAISPLWLAVAALPPTVTAIAAFQLLPG